MKQDKREAIMLKKGWVRHEEGWLSKKEAENLEQEEALKTTIERIKTAQKTKKIRKTKKPKIWSKQEKEGYKERKVLALKKFSDWSPEKSEEVFNEFKQLVLEKKPQNYIAAKLSGYGFKQRQELAWWVEARMRKKEVYLTYKEICTYIKIRHGKPSENWRRFSGSFKERVEFGLSPIFSTNERSVKSRQYAPIEKGKMFAKELEIIPDIYIQPIKRLRLAAHFYTTATNWKNGSKLRDLSVSFCKTIEDKFLTHEGGIIVSKALHTSEGLDKGDKLLGVNGLKGIICEVRELKTDILINKEQIWAKKISKRCGGAVLELKKNNTLSCFYQSSHTIRPDEYKNSEGLVCGTGYGSRQARFSPDLVPFLVHYVGFKTLIYLTQANRERITDYLRFLNASFKEKEGDMYFKPSFKTPEKHLGGKLISFEGYLYCKTKWKEGLDKTAEGDYETPCYPLKLGKLWVPDWLEEKGYFEYTDDKGNKHETALALFLTDKERRRMGTRPLIKVLYQLLYTEIEGSISSLTAVATNTEPTVIILNQNRCNEENIKENDEVLVWRHPVVSARIPGAKYSKETKHSNIFKLKVKFGARQKTAEINVATMRLMFGDFDGDPLYIMKIPKNIANDLRPGEEIEKEIELIKKEIEEIDNLKEPTTRRDILISMRRAFIDQKQQTLKGEKEAAKLHLIPENELRTNDILFEEAEILFNEEKAAAYKIGQIGGLTKWGWMSAKKEQIPDLIKATQAIEIMKDRADTLEYNVHKDFLQGLKDSLVSKRNEDGSFCIIPKGTIKRENDGTIILTKKNKPSVYRKDKHVLSEKSYGYEQFVRFTSKSAYGKSTRRKAPTYSTLSDIGLVSSNSVMGKWLRLLTLSNRDEEGHD